MAPEQPVRKVSVVTTGSVDIHVQQAARTRAPMLWWVMAGRRWMDHLPIHVVVIEHAGPASAARLQAAT